MDRIEFKNRLQTLYHVNSRKLPFGPSSLSSFNENPSLFLISCEPAKFNEIMDEVERLDEMIYGLKEKTGKKMTKKVEKKYHEFVDRHLFRISYRSSEPGYENYQYTWEVEASTPEDATEKFEEEFKSDIHFLRIFTVSRILK